MNSEVQAVLQSWSAPLGVNVLLFLVAAIYLRGWFRLRDLFPNLISVGRLSAFLTGIIFIWLAIGSRFGCV